jgi:hypothetical protein
VKANLVCQFFPDASVRISFDVVATCTPGVSPSQVGWGGLHALAKTFTLFIGCD